MNSGAGEDTRKSRAIIRDMIRHENQLRTERLGWLLTLNGLLFAALGFAWDADESVRLVGVLAFLGVVVAVGALVAMNISDQAIAKLRCWACAHPDAADPPVVGIQSSDLKRPWINRLAPWNLLPWSLMIVWPALFVLRCV